MAKFSTSRRKEILEELATLNKKAMKYMLAPGSTFKPKYNNLQKTPLWKKAKKLIIEYTLLDKGNLRCDICDKPSNDLVLHHTKYEPADIFCPIFCSLIHLRCHAREHEKKKVVRKSLF